MSNFIHKLRQARQEKRLIVQPRLGFGSPRSMREALLAVRECGAFCVGTLTLDSYTRCGDYITPLVSLKAGREINGYPLLSHPVEVTREFLGQVETPDFPIQVRHGTPHPKPIFKRMVELGLDATEGGPVSYCLPYGRVPLHQAVASWWDSCLYLAGETEDAHLESFGGCLMGQLCPPSLLVAVALLEGMFFRDAGIRSVSLSYAQGPSAIQDEAALRVLRARARRWLGDIEWSVVLYTYMGIYPGTPPGADLLLQESAQLAERTSCERLIVKTRAERWQIPTVSDNLDALRHAEEASQLPINVDESGGCLKAAEDEIAAEVDAFLDAVLNLHSALEVSLIEAFRRGILDVPFCLHADNAKRAISVLDERGWLCWAAPGNLPLPWSHSRRPQSLPTAEGLLKQLGHVASRYDARAASRPDGWGRCTD